MSVDFWFSLACSMIGNFSNQKTAVPTKIKGWESYGCWSFDSVCCNSCKVRLLSCRTGWEPHIPHILCLQRKKQFFLTSCNPANLFENWLYSCLYFKLLMTSLIVSIIQKYKYGVIFYYNLLSNNTIY